MEDLLFVRIAILLVIGVGLILGYDFAKKNKIAGIGTVATLSVMGLVVFVYTYVSLPPLAVGVVLVVGLAGIDAVAYVLLGRNLRVPLLLSFLPFMATSFFTPLITLKTVLTYESIVFAVVISFDYSGMSMAEIRKRTDRRLRILILPFFLIERVVTRGGRTVATRSVLITSYAAYCLAVTLIPLYLVENFTQGLMGLYFVIGLLALLAVPAFTHGFASSTSTKK